MKAKVETDYLTILHCATVEGVVCVVVGCRDYDDYVSLPKVISFEGNYLGKTGWNSDKNHCYYQSNAKLAKRIQ